MELLEIRLIGVKTTGFDHNLGPVSIKPGQISKTVELENRDDKGIVSLRIDTRVSFVFQSSDKSLKTRRKTARISVAYRAQFLNENLDTPEHLLKGTAIFMVWPYIRAMVSHIFAEAHIMAPPLPVLNMQPVSASADADNT